MLASDWFNVAASVVSERSIGYQYLTRCLVERGACHVIVLVRWRLCNVCKHKHVVEHVVVFVNMCTPLSTRLIV